MCAGKREVNRWMSWACTFVFFLWLVRYTISHDSIHYRSTTTICSLFFVIKSLAHSLTHSHSCFLSSCLFSQVSVINVPNREDDSWYSYIPFLFLFVLYNSLVFCSFFFFTSKNTTTHNEGCGDSPRHDCISPDKKVGWGFTALHVGLC